MGIPPSDRKLVGRPYCTSKLKAFDDLARVHTYGFRGEALYLMRVAASDVVITTKCQGEDIGVRIALRESQNRISPAATNVGTSVKVSGLFSQFPVRQRQLRSKAQQQRELVLIKSVLVQYALAHPNLRISCSSNHNFQNI